MSQENEIFWGLDSGTSFRLPCILGKVLHNSCVNILLHTCTMLDIVGMKRIVKCPSRGSSGPLCIDDACDTFVSRSATHF